MKKALKNVKKFCKPIIIAFLILFLLVVIFLVSGIVRTFKVKAQINETRPELQTTISEHQKEVEKAKEDWQKRDDAIRSFQGGPAFGITEEEWEAIQERNRTK